MRESDLAGKHGEAWRVTVRANREQHATIDAWLVCGAWHPAWSYWLVSAVHLRDLPGQSKPAYKQFTAATHEFVIVSLQSAPGMPEVKPDPDDPDTLRRLEPTDVVKQFVGTDAEAARLVLDAVKAIIIGGQSPDSDYRSWWERAIPRTLEHIRFGGHPE